MRIIILFSFVLTFMALFVSCKKDNGTGECFSGLPTTRQISDKRAIVKVTATVNAVYLVEEGSIDTKLIPCNLPKEFLQHDLQVTVSGKVKGNAQNAGPCCSENFVITKISR